MVRFIAVALPLCAATVSFAQHSHHRPEHMELHQRFYSNWMMPDHPTLSCCDNKDCAPAKAKQVNGEWYAKRDIDLNWRKIPPEKIEINRDSPDGRSHMCAPLVEGQTVYCFILGTGG